LNNNELSIYKQGTGGEKIQDLLPGVYLINCEDSEGVLSGSSTIEINENNQLIEVDCFSSCTSPVIEIQLSPAGTSWDVESSDGIADYTSYRSGKGYMKIPVELGQLYRLKAQYNTIERTSDVVSFTSSDARCSEIIDIKMDSYSILLDDACSDNNWEEVIKLDKESQNRANIECSHYLCLSQAYSENGNDEKALDIILEGWDMVDEKQTCLSFHTNEEYIYNLLFFAEKYGLTEANIQTKEIDDKIEKIIEMPLRATTEMKALFVYLSVKILNINKKKELWNNSDMDFRNKNKDNYCMETEDLIDGSYSIETLEDLMELLGSFNYANKVENDYKIRLQKALKVFGC